MGLEIKERCFEGEGEGESKQTNTRFDLDKESLQLFFRLNYHSDDPKIISRLFSVHYLTCSFIE